ncbi:hypothetical protein Tco_0271075 [Tanacetum coccineum]
MVVMTYQKSYSIQHTMINVLSVEVVFSSPWIITFSRTDAEQERPTIKKLEVKQVDFKLGEDCWEMQVKRSCKVRVGSNGNLLWEASVLLGRKKGMHGDDIAKTICRLRKWTVEVYGYAFWVNQCTSGFDGVNEPGSGAKRSIRCGRNQIGFESMLGKKEKVIACTSRQLKVLMKDFMTNVVLTSIWRDEDRALQEASTTNHGNGKELLMPRVVKSRDEIFSRWGYCDNHDLSRLDNQSIERDRLIGIGFVLDFVEFISFTFGDKEMISVIEAVSR